MEDPPADQQGAAAVATTAADMRTLDANRTDEDRRFLVRNDQAAFLPPTVPLLPLTHRYAVCSRTANAALCCAAGSWNWSLCSAWLIQATFIVRAHRLYHPPLLALA